MRYVIQKYSENQYNSLPDVRRMNHHYRIFIEQRGASEPCAGCYFKVKSNEAFEKKRRNHGIF